MVHHHFPIAVGGPDATAPERGSFWGDLVTANRPGTTRAKLDEILGLNSLLCDDKYYKL